MMAKKIAKTKAASDQPGDEAKSINNPAVPLTGKAILEYLGWGNKATSGVQVTPRNALTVSPVWQAVNVITSDVSRTPFLTYREREGGGKERAIGHPVYRLLRRNSGDMTSNLWISRMLSHALLYGNGYSRIHWRGSTIQRLEWLHRDWVEPKWENGKYYYLVHYPFERGDNMVRIPKDDMFHLVGLTVDDLGGLSLVDFARNTIGRQMAAELFGDDFFSNSAVPSGFFKHPGEMSEDAQQRFLAHVMQRHAGAGKRWKPAILEESMEYQAVGVSPTDALLIDQLKFGVMDVARFFNLPPHKLGDASRVNYNSLEQEEKAYYSSSLGSWLSRFEFEANDKLFVDSEVNQGYFTEFLQDSWLKADTAARFNAYAVAINWGIMSRNEVRLRENLNPYDGGDEYLTPLTHQQPEEEDPESEAEDTQTEPPEPEDDEEDETDAMRAVIAAQNLMRASVQNATRLLYNVVSRQWKRHPNFLECINSLRVRYDVQVRGMIAPSFRAWVTDDEAALADTVGEVFAAVEEQMLRASECQPQDLQARIAGTAVALAQWSDSYATDLVLLKGKQYAN